jgi:LysM repeat protein
VAIISQKTLGKSQMKYDFTKILLIFLVAFIGIIGCSGDFDFDMRDQLGGRLDTSSAANSAVANRPDPDERGVITFPNYQVVVARNGDKIGDLAERISADSEILGSYNGISQEAVLRHGEIIALPPSIVASDATGKPLTPTVVDISELLDNPRPASQLTSVEPKRHQVVTGETAFTIARFYKVSADTLADWNSLDTEMNVRPGQYLLIPITGNATTNVSAPGQGSPTPTPPSSARPHPQVDLQPKTATSITTQVPIANTGETTAASSIDTLLVRPVSGNIIRSYKKGQNDGIDISAKSGSSVAAAGDGIVAAVTKDTDGVPILVIKHADGILTVYTNIDELTVEKGDRVNRGQKIAEVGTGTPSFLHFEVRRGLVSVDPDDYI